MFYNVGSRSVGCVVHLPGDLIRYVVRITQYCEFQNYVRVFLYGGVSLRLSDD